LTTLLLNNLKSGLNGKLPGASAQKELAPINRSLTDPALLKLGEYKPSAVMILLFKNQQNEWQFPLIQRLEYEGVHGGQMALPGGKQEEADKDLEQTAIRECCEEIGVAGKIHLLGKLSPLYIPVSAYLVQPFVSYLENTEPEFYPQVSEVQAIFPIKLQDLLNENNLTKGEIPVRGTSIHAPYFRFENKIIWGATAMILNEMKALLKATS